MKPVTRIPLLLIAVLLAGQSRATENENNEIHQESTDTCDDGACFAAERVDVIIIGAGAAGLAASYTLAHNGIMDFFILEASSNLGGRTQKDTTFAPYPLDIGASFIQRPEDIHRIVSPDGIQIDIPTGAWEPNFLNYTYHDFISDYIAPKDPNKFIYGCRVTNVDYTHANVLTTCENGRMFLSNHVIVTVPLTVLKQGGITFNPLLPDELTVNHPGNMFPGFKIAIEFAAGFPGRLVNVLDNVDDHSYFWSISSIHDKNLSTNGTIMLGFVVGKLLEPFANLNDTEIKDRVLDLIDPEFDYLASKLYMRHKLWDWTSNNDFRGTFSHHLYDGPKNVLGLNKIWIAGEAFPIKGENSGWVDSAAFSGDSAAMQLIKLKSAAGRTGYGDDYEEEHMNFWEKVALNLGRYY